MINFIILSRPACSLCSGLNCSCAALDSLFALYSLDSAVSDGKSCVSVCSRSTVCITVVSNKYRKPALLESSSYREDSERPVEIRGSFRNTC